MSDLIPLNPNTIESIARPKDIPASVPPQDWTLVREWLRSKRSEHTKRSYARNIDLFYKTIARPVAEITLTDIQDYADLITSQHSEPATQAQMLASVKSLLTFGHKTGKLGFNVGAALQLPQGKNKLAERMLQPEQLYKMLDEAKKNTRDHVLLLLLYGSGARCSEICGLRWYDCQSNRDTGQITVFGKRNKTRSIPIHPKIWQALQEYKPENAKPNEYVFPSRQADQNGDRRLTEARIWQIVHDIADRAGIKDISVSPHFLRHTHATRALENHVSIKLLQETLGHESLATTGRYTHVRPEDSSSFYLGL